MAKATPKLESRKDINTGKLKQTNIPILIDFSFDGKRMWIQSGQNIDRNKWDEKNHRVKPNYIGSVEINAIVASKCDQVNKIYRDMILAGKQPNVNSLRNALNGNDVKDKKTLVQHYEEFIEGYKLKASIGTVKKLSTNKKHLIEFAKKKKINLDFEVVDTMFFNKYVEYCLVDLKHTNGTVARNVKVLKWFLNHCVRLGYTSNYAFKTFRYKFTEPEILALTGDELMKIQNLKTNNICLAQVRDCFLLMSYTTLRYSDASAIRKSDVADGNINIISQKTKSALSIPIIPQVELLLDRYKDISGPYIMPFISNQKMNEYLKKIGELAGLNRLVTKVKYRGSQKLEETFKLYEVLTCHFGRKSGISIMFNQGVDSEMIRSISNHKSLSSFARYNKIDNGFKAVQMNKAFGQIQQIS
ncbi:site-specific integrase [Pedobacter sp. Leaf170]|uniref:site-specific integrase n=1 Tax=Pedobacter sp. Leaf170 TaxID=2876558 RepID=UPI001E2E94FB|nr:site-specific integrase [Pedobacter sp. Leaf170]